MPEPSLTPTVAVPLDSPKHLTGVEVALALRFKQVPGLTFTVAVSLHPFLSVTVTVYVPAERSVIVVVVCPPGLQE